MHVCMNQGIAMRGHDESPGSLNRGNFLEILNMLRKRDALLAAITWENAPQNATMTSPDVQKDLIHAHAQLVRRRLDTEIGDAYYCIMADESRDVSKKEQLVFVNHFVEVSTGILRERLVDIQHVPDTCAPTLCSAIVNLLSSRERPIETCRGQGYDGASSMSGEIAGLQTLIKAMNDMAYYTHCWAHKLQLALVTACTNGVTDIAVFFDLVQDIIHTATSSCKRNDQLLAKHKKLVDDLVDELAVSTGRGQNQETALSAAGNMRWSSFWRLLHRLIEMFNATAVIQNVEEDGAKAE
ncbi:zinc finger MYM-type protein 1-like [Petromyzon marinus]|uniref:zinc finger MYM-type protein 1-like n=1 Tax=Petromyzon marinus TaxID=7757 RepID=UPI003F71078F